jgi:hypothetical protein
MRQSALDRAEEVGRQAQEVTSRHSDTSRKGRPGSGAAVARALGINERSIQRNLKAAGIGEEAKAAARATGLDRNMAALLQAAAAPAEEQAGIIVAIAARKADAKVSRRKVSDLDRAMAQIAGAGMLASLTPVRGLAPGKLHDVLGDIDRALSSIQTLRRGLAEAGVALMLAAKKAA